MTREHIEKAAREYSDVIWNNDRARDISKIAFSSAHCGALTPYGTSRQPMARN